MLAHFLPISSLFVSFSDSARSFFVPHSLPVDCAYFFRVRVRFLPLREFKLPWREANPPNYLNDKVDSDQQVVNKEVSLCPIPTS